MIRYCPGIATAKVAALLVAVILLLGTDGFSHSSPAAISCSGTITNISFGNVDTTSSSSVDSTGTLTISCTSAKANQTMRVCVDIDGGTASDATSRKMTSGANQLRFQLYSDAARTTAWGSWFAGLYGGGVTWDIFCSSTTCGGSRTIYGRVPGSQTTVRAGSYSSSLGIVLSYKDKNDKTCWDNGDGTLSGSFSATATVVSTCNVSAPTNLNFGTATLLNSAIDQTNSFSVTCTNGTSYNVGLSAGNGSGATVAARKMTKTPTTSTTTYSLYRNSSRSQVWGTTIGTDTQTGTGSGSAQSLTVYGRVPSQTTPPPGVYTDTIVVTVTY